MRSRWLVGLGIALSLCILLMASAPARLLLHLVPTERIVLQGLSGTIWDGKAARALVASGDDWLHLGAVDWELSPLSLLVFNPSVTVQSKWGRQQINTTVSGRSGQDFQLQSLDAVFDAGLLRRYLPVGLVGSVALQFETLVISDSLPADAQGRIVWQDAGWLSPQGPRSLGSYALEVESTESGVLNGEVLTLAGDLSASGPVSLRDGDYQLDVLLSGGGLSDPQLRHAIQLMATPEGDAYRVKLTGTL